MEKLKEKKEEKVEEKQAENKDTKTEKKTNHKIENKNNTKKSESNKTSKDKKESKKKQNDNSIKKESSKKYSKKNANKVIENDKKKSKEQESVKNEENNKDVKTKESKKSSIKNVEEKTTKNKKEKKEISKDDNKVVEESPKNNKKKDVIMIITIVIASLIVIALTGYSLCVQQVNQNIDFRLIGNENIELEVGTEYEEQGIIANCNSTDLTKKVNINSNLDINKIGNYQIEYHIKNSFLHVDKTIYRNILVKDTTAPKITIDGKNEITIYEDEKFTTPKCIAKDNYDGNITDNVKIDSNVNTAKVGTYTVTYTVKDSSGNEATEKVKVKVKKKRNPYIVVSISNQTLKYYEYGRLALSSNIVTGINGKTPTGTFKILNKARNIVLKGEDYASFVNYWIAFLGSSFGFHDASWRSNFGGKIYKTNGSHGCINMPYYKVQQLYNLAPIGTPVYIRK